MQRTTLNGSVRVSGVGLFSAQPISLKLSPMLDQSGTVFKHQGILIPAHINNLSTIPVHPAFAQMKPRCTSLSVGGVNIATVEHVLSALAGLGITDAFIEIDSDQPQCEIPIMDGSAIDFVNAIQSVGIQQLNTTINPITIAQAIRIEEGDSSITIEPADSPSYSYTLEYEHKAITNASVVWDGDTNEYINRIAPARTFCLEHEAVAMQSAGMFTHLGTKDMLVLGDVGPIDNALRHEHECALHKLLDLIGDLSLVGRPLCAKVTAIKSGHAMAHLAALAIVEQIAHES